MYFIYQQYYVRQRVVKIAEDLPWLGSQNFWTECCYTYPFTNSWYASLAKSHHMIPHSFVLYLVSSTSMGFWMIKNVALGTVVFLVLVKIALVDVYMHICCYWMNLWVSLYLHVYMIIYIVIVHSSRLYT